MSDEIDRLYEAECAFVDRVKQGDKETIEAADEITALRAEIERLTAENEHWRKQDDAIRAEFGGKRDGRATIECLREAFAATWSEEEALFQATLDMKTKELRAENERLRAALEPFASLFLFPDDLAFEYAEDIRADADWDEDSSDAQTDNVFVLRRDIRRARAALEGK